MQTINLPRTNLSSINGITKITFSASCLSNNLLEMNSFQQVQSKSVPECEQLLLIFNRITTNVKMNS